MLLKKKFFDLNPKKGGFSFGYGVNNSKGIQEKEETKKVVVPKGNSYTVQNGESFLYYIKKVQCRL